LPLRVVEISGNRDHRLGDRLAEIVLRRLLHLLQHFGRDLRRREFLTFDVDPRIAVLLGDLVQDHVDVLLDDLVLELAADQPLHAGQRVRRIGDGLAFRRLADQDFTFVGIGDDRRRRAVALGILDDLDVLALHDGHARVRRSEVDTDNLAHLTLLLNGPGLRGDC
jgi:hypothetical protein